MNGNGEKHITDECAISFDHDGISHKAAGRIELLRGMEFQGEFFLTKLRVIKVEARVSL